MLRISPQYHSARIQSARKLCPASTPFGSSRASTPPPPTTGSAGAGRWLLPSPPGRDRFIRFICPTPSPSGSSRTRCPSSSPSGDNSGAGMPRGVWWQVLAVLRGELLLRRSHPSPNGSGAVDTTAPQLSPARHFVSCFVQFWVLPRMHHRVLWRGEARPALPHALLGSLRARLFAQLLWSQEVSHSQVTNLHSALPPHPTPATTPSPSLPSPWSPSLPSPWSPAPSLPSPWSPAPSLPSPWSPSLPSPWSPAPSLPSPWSPAPSLPSPWSPAPSSSCHPQYHHHHDHHH